MLDVKPGDNILKVKRHIEHDCGLVVSKQRLLAHDDPVCILGDETEIEQLATGHQLILQILPPFCCR